MQLIKVISLCLILLSCKENKKIEQLDTSFENDKYDIISQLINNVIPSSPPPPPPPDFDLKKMDTIYYKKYMDSLKNIEINIALSNEFLIIDKVSGNLPEHLDSEFINLLKKLENRRDKSKIQKDSLNLNSNYKVTIIDVGFYENLKDLFKDNYSRYIAISTVVFNKFGNKAVVCFGEHTGSLSGYSVIYFLSKINSTWKIVGTKRLSIS
ncbi:hypothetical protein [Aquimarina longa]|uniref:hypothetical protein n=1 Tax=Aquimarina longa TaxID=1080221 RepID=UPI000781474D|nr:hypothetical protein [Aquimarina longa]